LHRGCAEGVPVRFLLPLAKMQHLAEQVVVITGGSSGIGRETALACARQGARVVVAARGPHALDATVAEITGFGGRAHGVVADVTISEQLERLAAEAIARFGRIDTWVNGAAVITYSTVEQLTRHEIARVIAVDLTAVIDGSRIALAHMAERGTGTIINIASVLGVRAFPLLATYSAAKAGVIAFSEALRVELERDHPGIGVTVILPSSVNTPLYAHARSKVGRQPKPYPPVYDPAAVASAIAFAAEHRRREVYIGAAGRALTLVERFSGAFVDRYLLSGDRAAHDMLSKRPDDGVDNLDASLDGPASSRGDTPARFMHSAYTEIALRPWLAFAAAVAIGGLVWRFARR
jgi:short-subunit dehydrogenase